MRAFIQCNKDMEPMNPNVYNAYYGFKEMGIECVFFNSYEQLDENYHTLSDVISGGIGMIKKRLEHFGIYVEDYDYPEELKKYLGRKVWKSTMNNIRDNQNLWPVFVKSTEQKKLTGKVISKISDLVGCGISGEDYPVFCSEPVNMLAEWRIFVRYGKVLDAKLYKGDWTQHYDPEVVQNAINDFISAPDAYGIDFAVTDKGETILIEVNDGFALGCYGMAYWNYSKFLITRWAQITNTLDEYWYI